MYEHEEGILSADLHPTQDLMASIDGEGMIICREIENPDCLLCQFNPTQDYIGDDDLSHPETANLLFNSLDEGLLFVTLNNVLMIYRISDIQSCECIF